MSAAVQPLLPPFPFFGGKRSVTSLVWERFGRPKHYIEPFCGSAAMLLAAPRVASLEVVSDLNGFIANFYRATKYQPAATAEAADYPVSHIDQMTRHGWLMAQRERLMRELADPHWPGDAEVAGWWLWGQCSWIGSGWCEWNHPGVTDVGDLGRQIPHIGNAGMGALLTSGGQAAWIWLHKLAKRLERVRVLHGDWSRCLNNHYGDRDTAVFLDPPYRSYERLYGVGAPVADAVEAWAREHADLRIALCGHRGDYSLPGWDVVEWDRKRLTYSGNSTTNQEAIWFSPACLPRSMQGSLFSDDAFPAPGLSLSRPEPAHTLAQEARCRVDPTVCDDDAPGRVLPLRPGAPSVTSNEQSPRRV